MSGTAIEERPRDGFSSWLLQGWSVVNRCLDNQTIRNHLSGATSHTSVIPGLSHKASPKLVVQLAVIIG